MKKIIVFILVLIFIILPVYITVENNIIASSTRKKLIKAELPENTEIIDSISIAGKVEGNGNGMQYFGAVLLKSDLSEKELQLHYKKYKKNEWEFIVCKQDSGKIDVINVPYYFEKYDHNDVDKYFILYSWGSSPKGVVGDLLNLDIRGH